MQQDLLNYKLTLTPSLKTTLRTVATWSRFLAIVSFVSQGVSLISNIKDGNFIGSIIGVAISVFLNILILKFATTLLKALDNEDQTLLASAFGNLKTYFMIVGILLIIVGAIVLLAMLGAAIYFAAK